MNIKETEEIHLGKIKVKNQVFVTDPSYNTETNNHCLLIDFVKEGKYDCYATFNNDVTLGKGISEIRIALETNTKNKAVQFYDYVQTETNQCGIFDKPYFEKYQMTEKNGDIAKEWYKFVYNITTSEEMCGLIDDQCMVAKCSSDNKPFKVYVGRNKQKDVVAIRVKF